MKAKLLKTDGSKPEFLALRAAADKTKTAKILMLAGLTLIMLLIAPACQAQQYNVFLRVSGISGEATATNHVGDIVATSFSFAGTMPITGMGDAGVPTVGRVAFSELSVSKFVDKASPALMYNLATGRILPTVTLYVQSMNNGKSVDFYIITLSTVIVTGLSASEGLNARPAEVVNFTFGQIQMQYVAVNSDGSTGSSVNSCWNMAANQSCGTSW